MPKGYRVGSYVFDPGNELGGELTLGQSYENQVGIYNDGERPVEIKKLVANNPSFTVNLETLEPGKAFNLKIKSTDKLAVGANKLFIKLLTDDPKQDTLEVSVIVNVAAEKKSATGASTGSGSQTDSQKAAAKNRKPEKK